MSVVDGLDISRWQTSTPALANYEFAFARASYGLTTDPMYHSHDTAFRQAGIVRGAYHFGYSRTVGTPEAQAAHFLAVAGNAELLALDLEGSASSMSNAEARAFIAAVHATGRKVGLYHSASGFPALGQDWNWIAAWDQSTFPHGADFWQYQGSPLDRDRYRGTLGELYALAGRTLPDTSTGDSVTLYTADPSTFRIGVLTVKTDRAHAYLDFETGTLVDITDIPTKWTNRPAYGPVRLIKPIPGGAAGADRSNGWVVFTEPGFVLASDVVFTPANQAAAQRERDRTAVLAAVEGVFAK